MVRSDDDDDDDDDDDGGGGGGGDGDDLVSFVPTYKGTLRCWISTPSRPKLSAVVS